MSRETLTTGHEIKKAVLEDVIKNRIWKIKPVTLSIDEWSKQRKIGFQYTFTDKTYEKLGEQYGVTKENIRQLNHRFLDNIWKVSPPELQTQYPRETIPDKKPFTQKMRENRSRKRSETLRSWDAKIPA